jgi:hypothetical protein
MSQKVLIDVCAPGTEGNLMEYLIRFLAGGIIVSAFAVLGVSVEARSMVLGSVASRSTALWSASC